jgi:proline- and glutamine-rich splicing factor
MQVPPDWQTSPAQQPPPTAPQLMQVRGIPPPGLAQPRPLAQTAPAQQTSPLAPQGSQVVPASAAWQERLAPQAPSPPPAQQAMPRLPQATQLPPVQRAPDPVQVIGPPPPPPASTTTPPQQVWPTAPHVVPPAVWQDPFEQVPAVPAPVQADPLATHIPTTQQPPA